MSNALAKQSDFFTTEQSKMIRDSFLSGATEGEALVLMELARVRRLNPITRQIHFVKRWDSEKSREVWSAQVGIDGFRAIAERTGQYDGQDEPEFEYDGKGAIRLCRVRIYRKDWSRPAVGVAHFSEYAQAKKDGSLTRMWATKPHVMIAKCAEALAFRKAFPEDTSGLYTAEEMGQEIEKDVTPSAPVNGAATAELKAKVLAQAQLAAVNAPPASPPRASRMPIVEAQGSTPTPFERIRAIGADNDLAGKALSDVVKVILGSQSPKKPEAFTDADVVLVEDFFVGRRVTASGEPPQAVKLPTPSEPGASDAELS